ncbi:hypothetical protein containing Bacitracin resistance domain [Thermococcus cleftensis]|uniref:Undecaprenyl-diphosphatase n=1 Tax=Thermococcus cleftensis (strain DSM 27260 / KACC 17922 / CL1) TaxID=163003 RepID=I3ZS17_THECF|nr:undecaprenyl-diphosphate phosphatase [Thermococcus cleftensis]AFL94501.1 hypothetical protein containing Bacitracin resistance domain [Thermococcus cleftensis]
MVSPVDYVAPLISGIVIALTSWLPVGLEGQVIGSILDSVTPDHSSYLVPAYLGTTFAVFFYFRDYIALGSGNALRKRFDSDMLYFVYASLFTLLIGYPLLRTFSNEISPAGSDMVNALVGLLLVLLGLFTGEKVPFEKVAGIMREREDEATLVDSVLSGVAQGVAVVGGLSRSGLVMLGLASTGVSLKKALELSFLVAPVYIVLKLAFVGNGEPGLSVAFFFTAFLSAFAVSIITMKLLIKLAEDTDRRTFLVLFGLIAIAVYLMGVIA